MNPAYKASSFRSQIRLPSHCKVSWDCFWRFWAAVYFNLFSRGSMLVVNRRLFESNEPSCSLPFSCVLPKEGLRADFAIAVRCAGPCSMILFAFCLFSPAEAGRFYFPLAPFPSRRSLFLSTFRQSCPPFYSTLVQIRCGLHPADRYIAPVWPSSWHFHPSRMCKSHVKTPLLPSKAPFRG